MEVHSDILLTGFQDGFGNFLNSGDFSDLTLITKHREFRVHKIILTFASEYFAKKLDELPPDTTTLIIESPFVSKDSSSDFELFLKYIYEGNAIFTSQNCIALLALAEYYTVPELKRSCQSFVIGNLTRDIALPLLYKAIEYNAEDIVTRCLQVLAKHFGVIVDRLDSISSISPRPVGGDLNLSTNFNSLPVEILVRLTRRDNLAVASEMIVYNVINNYAQANINRLSPQEISYLYETIRFPFLTYDQLKEVKMNNLIPVALITEAVMEKLKGHEMKEEEKANYISQISDIHDSGDYSRLKPRVAFAISLEFSSDFDDKGVFYYIGTQGLSEVWSNPAGRGRVRVSSSSVGKGHLFSVFDRDSKEFWTADVPSSWIQISLGTHRSLVPNFYSLRHGGNTKADTLRNWTLQGSTDSKNWIVLRRHINDTSMNAGFATASFSIPEQTISYKHFRILQTGHNSSFKNFLSISGFELYGDLFLDDTKNES